MSDLELTRRGLLGVTAAAGAGLLASGAPDTVAAPRGRRPRRRHADVVVVGAGPSGTAAAHEVAKAGHSVILMEARNRVGGKVVNHDIGDGKIVELGATFVGPTQDRIYALMDEFGLSTFKTYDTGLTATVINGRKGQISNTDQTTYAAAFGVAGAVDLVNVVTQFDEWIKQIGPGEQWKAPRAGEWDRQTLQSWMDQNLLSVEGKAVINALTRQTHGAEARDISLLSVLALFAAGGNEQHVGSVERVISTGGGAQDSRVVGGTQRIYLEIAKSLGSRVLLNAPARRVVQKRGEVVVVSDKISVSAKQVILAMAPALCQRIDYQPILPALRDQLTQRFPMGSYAKVEVFYDRPFWREAGSNGQAFGDIPAGLVLDQTPPDGTPGIVSAFIGGQHQRHWDHQDDAARRKIVLDALAQYFGPRMLSPRDYFEQRWTATEVYSRGGQTGFTAPGVLTGFGDALRAPVGRIKFAGTETADYWTGYMEGGIRAGQRAAKEAIGDLG